MVQEDRSDRLGEGGALPASDSDDVLLRSNVPPNSCRSGLAARSASRPKELWRCRLGLDLGELPGFGEELENVLERSIGGALDECSVHWLDVESCGDDGTSLSVPASFSSEFFLPISKVSNLRVNDGER